MKTGKVLVLGESCSDVFVYGRVERLSPAAPAPVFLPEETKTNVGMAGNVYQNLLGLGINCEIMTNVGFREITKTRFVDSITNTMFLRVDHGEGSITPGDFRFAPEDFDILVISDYDKGLLTENVMQQMIAAHPKVILDTKKKLGDWCRDAFLIKINSAEYEISKDYINKNIENKVIRTAGIEGCFYQGKKYDVDAVEIKDLSGAGDTFLAGLIAKYLEEECIKKAIVFANECATVAVQRRGIFQDFSGLDMNIRKKTVEQIVKSLNYDDD